MPNLTIGAVQTVYSADSRKFDTATAGVEKQLDQVGKQAEKAAAKVEKAGEVIDRSAAQQERAKERMRRAWDREMQQQDRAIQKEKEVARASELAAMRTEIEARAAEHAARANELAAAAAERRAKITENLKAGFAMAGIGIGVEFVADKLKEMVEKTMETGVELGHLSQQTGITVEDLSVLKYAAATSGVEFDTLTKGFKKLSTNIAGFDEGSKAGTKAFQAIGISSDELKEKQGNLFEVLGMIANRFKAMPDGAIKNAAATQLFGKAGSALIPILNQGADAIERMKAQAPIFTDADVEKMEKMHKASANVKASFENVGKAATEAFGPAITRYLNDFAEGIVAIQDAMKGYNAAMDAAREKRKTQLEEDRLLLLGKSTGRPLESRFLNAPKPPAGWQNWYPEKQKEDSGKDSAAKDTGAMTLNLNRLEDAWIEWLTQTRDLNTKRGAPSLYGPEDFAKMAAMQTASPNVSATIPGTALQTLDLNIPPPDKWRDLRESIDGTITAFLDVPTKVTALFNEAQSSLNNEMAKALTGQRTNFAGVFRGLGESGVRMGLQLAEGSIARRIPALQSFLSPTHNTNSMTVRAGTVIVAGMGSGGVGSLPGMPNGNPGPAGTYVPHAGGGVLGTIMHLAGLAVAAFRGGSTVDMNAGGGLAVVSPDYSLDNYQLPGRAYGGPVLAGVPYMVGERGPEPFVPSSDGHVFPTSMMRGQGGATYFIDATGAAAAETEQRVQRALERVHGSAVQMSTAAMAEHRRRTPNRGV